MDHTIIVRRATPDDVDTMLRFLRRLVDDHQPGRVPDVTLTNLRRDGFGADPLFEAWIAEIDGAPVGYVSFFRGYAGWHSKPIAFIHALYVDDAARRYGVARRLVAQVATLVRRRGWLRIELFVEADKPAVQFCEAIGMTALDHRNFRLGPEGVDRLADEADGRRGQRTGESDAIPRIEVEVDGKPTREWLK